MQRLKKHSYGIGIVLVLLFSWLLTTTHGFADIRRNVRQLQAKLPEIQAELTGQVWCTTRFSSGEWEETYGHYPAMTAMEILSFHSAPTWWARSNSITQDRQCYRRWERAYQVIEQPPPVPESADESAYEDAVVSYYLGSESPATDVSSTSSNSGTEDNTAHEAEVAGDYPIGTMSDVLCFSEIKTTANLVTTVDHAPGNRSAIEARLDALPDRSRFEQYKIRTSICFETWSEAAAFITQGEVQLTEDATEEDYHASIQAWRK